ncbi:MAG: WD40 repeat domain-containing serine/threonine protein kinase [Isosphaeraceae bacterium]
MTPSEAAPTSSEKRRMRRLLAYDGLLDLDTADPGIESIRTDAPPSTHDDERGRGRLMLLLRMLDAADPASGADRGGDGGAREEAAADETAAGVGGSPALFDRFEIIEEVGSGGFGFVVRARDRLLQREVALKMPVPERLLAAGDVGRFLREARAAARLDHPGIVRVFDAGQLGPLGYFIASEFCHGPNLRRWLRAQGKPVPPRVAAGWAEALADAVQHAHERGILHRDIKPDNVILEPGSGPEGFLPRLTDFGLAKLAEETGEDSSSGVRVGTLRYMAPEQAAGRRGDVGPSADIYAIGATLYEVLTGRPPFHGETEAETMRLVLEVRPIAPRTLRPGLPRDLETICLKCLRKESSRRYETAAELRDDLRRYLDGRPIVGKPVSLVNHAWGWARRRPGTASLVALVILLASGLASGFAWWVAWLEWHSLELQVQVERADRNAELAEVQARIAEERRRLAYRHHHAEGLRRAREALDARQVDLAQEILDDLEPDPGEPDSRGFAWRYLRRQAHREFSRVGGHDAAVQGWTWSPDGRALATWDLHRQVVLWDVTSGPGLARPRAVPTKAGTDLSTLRLSPDGTLLAAVDRTPKASTLRVIEPGGSDQVVRLDGVEQGDRFELRFDREGRRLAALQWRPDDTGVLWTWDLAAPRALPVRRDLGRDRFVPGGFAPDGRLLVVDRDDRAIVRDPWSGADLRVLRLKPPLRTHLVEFARDGHTLAIAWDDGLDVWQVDPWREVGRYRPRNPIVEIRLSRRGALAATLDPSGYVTLFDKSSPRGRALSSGEKRSLRGHWFELSNDGALLVSAVSTTSGGQQPMEAWDIDGARRLRLFPGFLDRCEFTFFPGTHAALLTGRDGPRIWRVDPETESLEPAGHSDEAWAVAFSPAGRILASGSDDTHERRTIKLWDPATGRELAGWKGHTATVAAIAFSPDGRLMATVSFDAGAPGHPNVLLWDAATRERLASLEGHSAWVRAVAFSPDGRTLATGGEGGSVRLWDVASRTSRSELVGHTQRVMSLAFSPDGKTLATASNDATARTWDVETGSALAVFRDADEVRAVAFPSRGKPGLLATANQGGSIKLRDPETGEVIRTIRGAADQLGCLAFTPEGRSIAAAGKGKVIRIWDIATGQELLALEGHHARVNALAFAPDGSALASCSHDGAVKLWHAGPVEAGRGR